MNRYKRSARSEPQTLNNTDDGIYFVNNGSNPKVPNIISRNQPNRRIGSTTVGTTMSATCLSQNQIQEIVEENVTVQQQQLLVVPEQQLPVQPLQEMTTEQVQIIQHPQDENGGLMYFLLEDGTLAQLDTSAGTPWLQNENIALQFSGQQQEQQFVGDDGINEQQVMVKENEMIVESTEEQQQQIDVDGLSNQPVMNSSDEQQGPIDHSCLPQQQIHDLYSSETQPLNFDPLEAQPEVNDEQNDALQQELHHNLDSSCTEEVVDRKQLQLPVLDINQQELKGQDDVFIADTTNVKAISETSSTLLASQINGEQFLMQQDLDVEKQELSNSSQQMLLEEAMVKMDADQQQEEEQRQSNPDQESYFLLQFNGQTLLLPMSSLSDQNTVLDENTQQLHLTGQYSSVGDLNQCETSGVSEITSVFTNSINNPSVQIANAVPSDDISVNMTSDERPKPFRFVLPPPANTDSNSEPLVKVEPNSAASSVVTTMGTTFRPPFKNNDMQEEVNEQPPMKRFKEGQLDEVKAEQFRKSSVIRPGKVVMKPTGSKTKVSNSCIYRCGACHKLFATKELALFHMVQVHKADPRTTKQIESPNRESSKQACSKCGVLIQLSYKHTHICKRGLMTTKFDQLEMGKQSERIQTAIQKLPSTIATASVDKKGSLKETSVIVEDPSATASVVQNSSKLRTMPSLQLNYPPNLTCCERTFVSLYYYLQHRLLHTRELNSSEPWKCEVCQVEFALKPELLAHFFSHNSDYSPARKRKSGTVASSISMVPQKVTGKVKQATSEEQNTIDDKDQVHHTALQQKANNKKKRGRPAKAQSSTNDDSSNFKEDEPQKSISMSAEKKGRGRPRRYLQDNGKPNGTHSSKRLSKSVERNPGRPVVKKANENDLPKVVDHRRLRPTSSDIVGTTYSKKSETKTKSDMSLNDKTSSSTKKNATPLTLDVEDTKKLDGLNQDEPANTYSKKRGRKPKNIPLKVEEEATQKRSFVVNETFNTTRIMTRRSMRNVASTSILTNGNEITTVEGNSLNNIRATRLRCSTNSSNDATVVLDEEQHLVDVKPLQHDEEQIDNSKPNQNSSHSSSVYSLVTGASLTLQSTLETVNFTSTSQDEMIVIDIGSGRDSKLDNVQKAAQKPKKSVARERKKKDETQEILGNRHIISLVASAVDTNSPIPISGLDGTEEQGVKKKRVQTTANRRHTEELMRMRTPASQKRVQDSFVEIFKRVKGSSAEDIGIGRNGTGVVARRLVAKLP